MPADEPLAPWEVELLNASEAPPIVLPSAPVDRKTEYGVRITNPDNNVPVDRWGYPNEDYAREGLGNWRSAWNPTLIKRVVRYGTPKEVS